MSINEVDEDNAVDYSEDKMKGEALVDEKKFFCKKSVIMLSIVVFLIMVVAVIGVVVVSRQKTEEDVAVLYSQVDGKEMYSILEEIRGEMKTMSLDEALGYLDDQIALHEGTELELEIRLLKAYYLNDNDLAEQAIAEVEKMNVNRLSDVYKMNYYSALRTIYDGLDDAEMYEKNNALYWEIYLDYYKGGAGG